MSARMRLLYVDRYYPETPAYAKYLTILNGLQRDYDVEAEFNLDQHTVLTVKNALAKKPFDAIVTHVPNDPGRPSYGESLEILSQLRAMASVPIIAYTGADGIVLLVIASYTDAVIEKSADPQRDLKAIVSYLEGFLGGQKDRVTVSPPAIRQADGMTTVDVKVTLVGGLELRGAREVWEECRAFKGKVMLRRLNVVDESRTADGRDFFDLLCLNAHEGCELRISVEGTGPEEERLARRLYGGLTSRRVCDMHMDQFDPTKKK